MSGEQTGPLRESRWCILRCSGRSTLPLAASLAGEGFEVWTPVETITKRVPRKNARRQVTRAIMPSYVFARETHVADLLQLADERGMTGHPDFSVLHAFGRIPMVADHHLDRLRRLEARRTPRKVAAYAFPRDQAVRVSNGIFGGLVGVVVRSTPAKTVLRFDDGFPFEFPTSFLLPDEVEGAQPVAQAA